MALASWITVIARQQQEPAPASPETPDDPSGEADDLVTSHVDLDTLRSEAVETWDAFHESFISWGRAGRKSRYAASPRVGLGG